MKINEVPQDKGFMIEGKISDLAYAVDNDGNYISTQSTGWKPKIEAMSLAWDIVFEKAEYVRKQVLAGKLSPIAFYMELNVMDNKILAGYMGISKWKVNRHLKMKNFIHLNPELLQKYADIFNLTADELVDLEKIREIKLNHED
jgi:hypothetical protein